MNIRHSSVTTHEYKSAQHELLMSIFISSVIAHKQCIPLVTQAQYASYLQNCLRHKALHAFL